MSASADHQPAPKGDSVILLPKQLRADWVDVMALDANVSHVEFRVACVIGSHFSGRRGDAYPSLETLARVTRLGKRTVWGAIRGLEQKGYLLVKRRELGSWQRRRKDGTTEKMKIAGGRGVANLYFPAFETLQVAATFRGQKLAERCNVLWEESLHGDGKKVVPTCNPTLEPSSKVNPSRADASGGEPLGSAGRMLRKRLGNDVFEAWFGKVDLIDSGPVVKLRAPSKFIRNRIIQDYLETALACWQANDPNVERLEIVFDQRADGGAP